MLIPQITIYVHSHKRMQLCNGVPWAYTAAKDIGNNKIHGLI